MTDLKKQIDELAGIKADMSKLKARSRDYYAVLGRP